jgi:hypothetical protein
LGGTFAEVGTSDFDPLFEEGFEEGTVGLLWDTEVGDLREFVVVELVIRGEVAFGEKDGDGVLFVGGSEVFEDSAGDELIA